MLQDEMQQAMMEAVLRLPLDQREVVILFHYENLTYREIAEVMQIPVSTVCSCMYRARQQLKRILSRGQRNHD